MEKHFEEVVIPSTPDTRLIHEKPCPNCQGTLKQAMIQRSGMLIQWGWACQKCNRLYREVEDEMS